MIRGFTPSPSAVNTVYLNQLNFRYRWGMKPIDLARNSRHSDVIMLLENHKKKKDLVSFNNIVLVVLYHCMSF